MENRQQKKGVSFYEGSLNVKAKLGIAVDICIRLTFSQRKLFEQTCFGPWLRVQATAADPFLPHLILQTQIVQDCVHHHEMWFDISGLKIRFGREEFCLITGLRFSEDPFLLKEGSHSTGIPFRNRMFPKVFHCTSVKLYHVEEIFYQSDFRKMDDHDAVRISLLMLLMVGFLGRQSHQVVSDDFLRLVEDLEAWNLYPWGSFIWSDMFYKLSNALKDRPKKSGSKYTVSGFVWAFKIWILEAFPVARQFFKKTQNVIPRAIAWKRTHNMTWEDCLLYLNVDQERDIPLETLIPTDAELDTDWWRASQSFFRGTDNDEHLERPVKKARAASPSRHPSVSRPVSPPRLDPVYPLSPHPVHDQFRDDMDDLGVVDTTTSPLGTTIGTNVGLLQCVVPSEEIVPARDAHIASMELSVTPLEEPIRVLEDEMGVDDGGMHSESDVSTVLRTPPFKVRCELQQQHRGLESTFTPTLHQFTTEETAAPPIVAEKDLCAKKPLTLALHGKVSSSQCGISCVQGYYVKDSVAPTLEAIFRKHGDIAAECVFKSDSVRSFFLEVVCEVVKRIQTNDVTGKMEEVECKLSDAEAANVNVSWLRPHLETILKRKEAMENSNMLMELKVNTILVKRAAHKDLRESSAELVAAQERYEKAEKCARVLHLVEKNLTNNISVSKSIRDSWEKQPILYAF